MACGDLVLHVSLKQVDGIEKCTSGDVTGQSVNKFNIRPEFILQSCLAPADVVNCKFSVSTSKLLLD